ncbi:MAG: sigma-E processing peptidase SpoIIGA [Clostridiales bacterium]|nr:sigma-E processing peptidase SpoIIGA [Clostridiales bacterium]
MTSEKCYNRGMYIEFVIADNFLLTYLAGATAVGLCHKRVDVFRLLTASAVGTVVAVFYPFMRLNTAAMFAVKISLWLVLCFIMFFKTKRPITSSLLFLGSTFAYGGACYALGLVIYSDAAKAAAFSRRYPLFLVLSAGAAVFLCSRYIIRRLQAARAHAPYELTADVEVLGARLRFDAFLDTGNSVFDDVTGLPVIITDCERFGKKLDGQAAFEFLKNVDNFRKMKVKTPAGETDARMIGPAHVTVYSADEPHKIDAMVGLVGKFSSSHELLMGPAVVAEGV